MPVEGEKTKAPALDVKGHLFHSYKVGIGQYVRHCDTLDATVRPLGKDTFTALVGGSELLSARTGKPQRFRSQHSAMRAIVEATARSGRA